MMMVMMMVIGSCLIWWIGTETMEFLDSVVQLISRTLRISNLSGSKQLVAFLQLQHVHTAVQEGLES